MGVQKVKFFEIWGLTRISPKVLSSRGLETWWTSYMAKLRYQLALGNTRKTCKRFGAPTPYRLASTCRQKISESLAAPIKIHFGRFLLRLKTCDCNEGSAFVWHRVGHHVEDMQAFWAAGMHILAYFSPIFRIFFAKSKTSLLVLGGVGGWFTCYLG